MNGRADRGSALFLALGALGGVVTMVLHPTDGLHALEEGAEGRAMFAAAVHALGVASLFLQLVGGWGVLLRLGSAQALVRLGLAAMGFASLFGGCAATISALTAPSLLDIFASIEEADRAALHLDLAVMHTMVDAFTLTFIVGSIVSVASWTGALLGAAAAPSWVRGLGVAVTLSGVVGALMGVWQPTVHSLGVFMLGYSVWLSALAAWLWRPGESPTS